MGIVRRSSETEVPQVSQTLHGTAIGLPISWGGLRVNVGIYGSPMECLGIVKYIVISMYKISSTQTLYHTLCLLTWWSASKKPGQSDEASYRSHPALGVGHNTESHIRYRGRGCEDTRDSTGAPRGRYSPPSSFVRHPGLYMTPSSFIEISIPAPNPTSLRCMEGWVGVRPYRSLKNW